MNWKQRLFKPKWQHKNADIRLESVASDQHPDLINSLVEIAGTDDDRRIRCAAIRRLHQLGNILKLYGSEKDQSVRTLLEERIRQLASSSNESRPALELRMQVVETTSDRDLIEHLAAYAPEAELRRGALARVSRQGVLGDCCIRDTDADNRRFAASLITQHTTMKRVIGALRKSDKTLYTELQIRLHNELLKQADPVAVQAEALKICSALEKQVLSTEGINTVEMESLHQAWEKIAGHASQDVVVRYQHACERLIAPANLPIEAEEESLDVEEKPQRTKPEETASGKPDTTSANRALARLLTDIQVYGAENTGRPRAASVKKLKNQLEITWRKCDSPHPEDRVCWSEANTLLQKMEVQIESQHQQFEKELEQAQKLLTQLETELEEGELHKALETRAKLQHHSKGQGKNRDWKKINSKMYGMQARLRELRDWHHWSNNKIRKRLTAEMEVLPAADLHPDALLDRIKSLQLEWKALEKSEQIPGDKKFSAAPWMWRKFSAAGHAAFDTAKPYLDKRSEIQSRHAQSLNTFCAELEQLAQAEPVDWTALVKGMTRGRKKLHDLNNVPARQRQKLARKLKSALDSANAALQAHYQVVEKEKMKLLRTASQLIHVPDRSEAITQAKSLQSDWKAAGSLWRSKEQELWNQFREYLDPLFNELKEQKASIRAADNERLSVQKALVAGLKEILKSGDDLSSLQGKVQGLQDGWKEIQHPDRRLLNQFQELVQEYGQLLEKNQRRLVESKRERWWLKSGLLHELTVNGRTTMGAISKRAATAANKAWPEESSEDTLETGMDQALKDIIAGNIAGLSEDGIEAIRKQARMLCIRLEFIAGMPSPDEDRDRRMKYQVDRLAESMSGESARQPASVEASEAEKAWLKLYDLPEADFKAFGQRIKLALAAISESI